MTTPNPNRQQLATLTGFKAEPSGADLDRIEARFASRGFADVVAVPAQSHTGRGWDVSVFAAVRHSVGGRR